MNLVSNATGVASLFSAGSFRPWKPIPCDLTILWAKRPISVAINRHFTGCHGPRRLSCRALGSVSHVVTASGLSVASDSAARDALASSRGFESKSDGL
jgi:hypothetical protein